MKHFGFKLTTRDVNILQFINNFGFCEMPHISYRFELKRPRNYQIVNRLVKGGLIKHERIFYARHGIFRLTPEGAKFTELPMLSKVPLATYDHNLLLIEVYLSLIKKYSDANWISERQLVHDKFNDGVGKRGHIPDGILILPSGIKIAIEVELTLKGERRLNSILKGYSTQFDYNEVWYICHEKLIVALKIATAKLPFIKVFSLKEILK